MYLLLLIHSVHGICPCSNCSTSFSPQGTAMGITCSFQMIGMGITNIIIGKMLDLIM